MQVLGDFSAAGLNVSATTIGPLSSQLPHLQVTSVSIRYGVLFTSVIPLIAGKMNPQGVGCPSAYCRPDYGSYNALHRSEPDPELSFVLAKAGA